VLVAKRRLKDDEVADGKSMLVEVVSMLIRMIKSNSEDRLHEDAPRYGAEPRD